MGETSREKCLNRILRELQELEEALLGHLEQDFAPEAQSKLTIKGEFSTLCIPERKSHVQSMQMGGSQVQHRCG